MGCQSQAGCIVVGVGAGAIGALVGIGQAIVVGVVIQRVGENPHWRRPTGQRNLPAADPSAVCFVVDFFAIAQAVSVRIGLVKVSAEMMFEAVGETISI